MSDSVLQHAKRANYQAYIWRTALRVNQDLPSPEKNGWEKKDDTLKPRYMNKEPVQTIFWS